MSVRAECSKARDTQPTAPRQIFVKHQICISPLKIDSRPGLNVERGFNKYVGLCMSACTGCNIPNQARPTKAGEISLLEQTAFWRSNLIRLRLLC